MERTRIESARGTVGVPEGAAPAVMAAAPERAQVQQDLALLDQAAVKFEAFFVAQMMKQMRQATAALADKDSALNSEVNQAPLAMADMAVADALAGQRAFGIADVLVRQMSGALLAQDPSAGERATPRKFS